MSTIKNVNRLVSVWRGNDTPPTDYHIWIKEDSTIWYYKDKWTLLTASDDKYNEIMDSLAALQKSLSNYYTKKEADNKFLTEEVDPTVPSWAKQPSKPTYTASEVHALPDTTAIPSKTSDLDNDSGFVTVDDFPKKISFFKNDVGYITSADVPTDLSEFNNDVGFITEGDIPTKISDLENDKNFITAEEAPSKVSDLENDLGFVTVDEIPSNLSEFTNDVLFTTKSEVEELLEGIDAYTKTEIDETFATKVEIGALESNLKDYADLIEIKLGELIDDKANINSPEFTGTPTVPTPGEDASPKQIANVEWVEEYVEDSVNKAVNVNTDFNDGVATITVAGKNINFAGGEGISITEGTDSFVINNTSVLEDHAVEDDTYGAGTDSLYGHVKLQHEFQRDSGTIIAPDELDGVAASPALVYSALQTALSAAKQEIEFSTFDVNVEGVTVVTYDPGDKNASVNFVGGNGVDISIDEDNNIVISADDLLTVDNIHEGTNVTITPYSDGGISINADQREIYAYEIDESGNVSEELKKVLSKNDEEDLKFGPSLMSQSKIIDLAWSEILKNNLTHKI